MDLSPEDQKALSENEKTFTQTEKQLNQKANYVHATKQFKEQHSSFSQGLGDATRLMVGQAAQAAVASAKDKIGTALSDPSKSPQAALAYSPIKAAIDTVTGVVESAKVFSDEFGKAVTAPNDYEAGVHAAKAAAAAMQFTATVLGTVEDGKAATTATESGAVKQASSGNRLIEVKPTQAEISAVEAGLSEHAATRSAQAAGTATHEALGAAKTGSDFPNYLGGATKELKTTGWDEFARNGYTKTGPGGVSPELIRGASEQSLRDTATVNRGLVDPEHGALYRIRIVKILDVASGRAYITH